MADCSYYRCIQERRFVKRELQKWSKDMVFIVGKSSIYTFNSPWDETFPTKRDFFTTHWAPHQLLLFRNYFSLSSSFIRSFQPQPRMLWKLFCRLCLMLYSKLKPVAEKATILSNFQAITIKGYALDTSSGLCLCRLAIFWCLFVSVNFHKIICLGW